MTRTIMSRLFKTYECGLIDKNIFAIEYEEATVELTDGEITLLTNAQADKTINKEFEPILKKLTRLFYLGQLGDDYYLYILTSKARSSSSAMRAFMSLTDKTMKLSKAEYKHLKSLMSED